MHEAFFNTCTKSTRKRRHNIRLIKPKHHILTDKERKRAAREHWDLHHGFDNDMSEILGHQADHLPPHPNLTMMPPHFNSLFEYFDNETMYHDNLKNSSELVDTYCPHITHLHNTGTTKVGIQNAKTK